ncbi:MAG: PAS domain-containing protein [Alphaproteobacteria bacterium]
MFSQSSIKRLQFAFAAMAGLTLLTLTVGCIAFAFSYSAQKRLLEETAPLLLDIERLSEVVIHFASASRQLETIDNQERLDRALARYRTQGDRLQAELLDLADYESHAEIVAQLKDMVRQLEAHEDTYLGILRTKIAATTRLNDLRREIYQEGRVFLERLENPLLDSSLTLVDAASLPDDQRDGTLPDALRDVQLLTDIGVAAERFLLAAGQPAEPGASARLANQSEVALAPAFRRLTQLTLKLRDRKQRGTVAASLKVFEEKALGAGGLVDHANTLTESARRLDSLGSQRTVLLAHINGLIDEVVGNVRNSFLQAADAAQRKGLIAVSMLVLLSIAALGAAIWIGWRLINRDIARRLDQLATSTVALASGDLDVAIDQSGSDELTDMARAAETFRQNARELRRAEAELADRLAEVEGANKRLLDANEALDKVNAELAESELRYHLAVDGSSVGIWDLDVRHGKLFWSARLKAMLGLPAEGSMLGIATFLDRVHPEDRAALSAARQRHLETGDDYDIECRLRREDGSYIWVRNCGQAVWDGSGAPLRMAGSVVDVTERKLADIRLNQHARELERSNRELDQFAYIASHDLKEPLRAIYNHACFLLEDYQSKLDDEGENRLNRLIMLSKRMEKLIADLLYFSRLGRGDQAMQLLDLNDVVATIGADLKETLMARNARIDVPVPLPSISGHPAHIVALFQNLISNGSKYNDAEEKVIEIGQTPSDDESGDAFETLYVRDNGIGIDDLFKDDVFLLFKRLNGDKAYGEGTGAGLTFVKKIVENHGGRIWLDSTPGNGTTFFFTLRRAA